MGLSSSLTTCSPLPGHVAEAQRSEQGIRWLADFQSLFRELNAINKRFLVGSLKDSGYYVLLLVHAHSEPAGLNVSDQWLVSKSGSTSELLGRLERQGCIVRVSHAADRRQSIIKLTEGGLRLVDHALEAHADQLKHRADRYFRSL